MSHSRDSPGVTAPLPANIVPLTAVWNPPPPFREPPLKKGFDLFGSVAGVLKTGKITAAQHINCIFPRNCDLIEIPGNSGFPIKEYGNAKKKADPGSSGKFSPGIPNEHFGVIFLGG